MGCLAKYCSVLPHFCCNDISFWNVDDSNKNGTNQISGWWGMKEWWWKIRFTPRAIRHVRRNWQFSSSGVAKILWVPSLETASWGAHTQFTFQKYPCLGPQMTPSAKILYKPYIYLWFWPTLHTCNGAKQRPRILEQCPACIQTCMQLGFGVGNFY